MTTLHPGVMDPRRHHVFVYGTLMRGEMRALDGMDATRAVFVGPVSLHGHTLVVPRGAAFPALVVDGTGSVDGELWRVDDALLMSLDRIEGATIDHERLGHGLFRRGVVRVQGTTMEEGAPMFHVDAFAYLWNRADVPLVPLGASWRAWHHAR